MKHFFLWLLCFCALIAGFGSPLAAQSPDTDLFQETLRIGRGAILHAEWDSTGSLILADTVRGAWLYSFGGFSLSDVAHIEAARLARFNPTRSLLAGVDDDNRVTFWDTTTFEQVATLPGHDVSVRALAWRPDGSQLATLDRTGRIITWDTDQQVKLLELRLESADEITWSPGGSHLAAVDSASGVIHIWNTTGELIFTSTPEYPGRFGSEIIWRNETQFLQSIFDEYPSGILWDIPSGEHTNFSQIGYVNTYSPDGSKLVESSGYGAAGITDVDTHETLAVINGTQAVIVTWSPNGRWIGFGGWTADINAHTLVTIADGTTGEITNTFQHDYTIKAIAWNTDGQTFLVVDSANRVFVSNATAPTLSNTSIAPASIAHTEIGTTAAWRDDGKVIAAADTNYGARLWDAETGEVLVPRMIGGQPFTQLAWQPDGTLLAAAGGDWWQSKNNNVYIWDSGPITGSEANLDMVIPHVHIVAGIAWSPDGQTLASAERSQYIRLWRPDEPNLTRLIDIYAIQLAPFIDYTQQINSLAWSPHGDLLDYSFSSSGNGGGVDLVDVAARALIIGDTPHNYASAWAWTPDNRLIWAKWGQYGDGGVPPPPVHDITLGGEGVAGEGQPAPVLTGLTGRVRKAIFSPNAQLLIGFDDLDNGVIWDVQTRTPMADLTAVDGAVWSPDSTLIAVYGLDGMIRVVDPLTGSSLYTFTRHFYANAYDPASNAQVIWSPDNRRVIVLDSGVIFIYAMRE